MAGCSVSHRVKSQSCSQTLERSSKQLLNPPENITQTRFYNACTHGHQHKKHRAENTKLLRLLQQLFSTPGTAADPQTRCGFGTLEPLCPLLLPCSSLIHPSIRHSLSLCLFFPQICVKF